jgi:signal peptide peptidase SppA
MSSSAASILARFLSAPPLMRADHLSAWLRDLSAGNAPRADLPVKASIDDGEDDRRAPWDEPIYEVSNGVAIVEVTGPLAKGYDAVTCWYFGMMSTDRLQEAVTELITRADVQAVVFKFNSPGGMAQGTPETAAQIAALSASKPTIAFTDSMCCSAAYWMASQCRLVLATLSADVGSIGTYLALYDYTEYLAKEGIKLELFARGTYKALGIAGRPLTDEQRAFLETEVDRTNARFLAAVRSARPGVTDETMQGQWFDGEQALAAKLIDQVVPDFSAAIGSLFTLRA